MRKKKIAHIQVIPKLSGVQQVSLDILSSLSSEKYEKYIVCGSLVKESDSFINKFKEAGCEIIIIDSFKRQICTSDFFAFFDFYRIFKKYRFDIIHTNSTKSGIVARIAARLAGINKIVHTIHGISFHSNICFFVKCFYLVLENFSTLFGHYNISVNNYYTRFYLKETKVIHNGICFNSLSCNSKSANDYFHIAFMARLDEQKDPFTFIRAAHYVISKLNKNCRVKFTLAGDGELHSQCINMIKELNMFDYIEMPGWINDKNSFLQNVDVIFQPSQWEAFGLVFLEAALLEIPSIASNVEGIPEVIIDQSTGLLVEKGCYKEFGKQLISLINDRSRAKQLGINARKHALSNFNIEKTVKQYVDLYDL